ncbi:hypothetical protein [Laspinema sp. D2d]|nr:hypothetical protein [Laspinema sp. D2d]
MEAGPPSFFVTSDSASPPTLSTPPFLLTWRSPHQEYPTLTLLQVYVFIT